jgi:glutamine synthetase
MSFLFNNEANDNYSILEYIWFDSNGVFRSKTRVLYMINISIINQIPKWNYDGSSTNQLGNENNSNTEIILVPCAFYKCPFRRHINKNSYIVLCELYDINGNPHVDNKRFEANKIFEKHIYHHPWYGYEQEYFITNVSNTDDYYNNYENIFGKNVINEKFTQGQFYCGNGSENIVHREFVDVHMEHCIYAGLRLCGSNAEVAPGQWEFQIGPLEGIESCDQLWVARFILVRLSEKYGYNISFHPKLFKNYNGSGCHTNFSTIETREKGGYDVIVDSMPKFEKNHNKHMEVYGKFNAQRLTGIHETAHINDFSWGIGTRHTSIRIGNDVKINNEGYFEDRRPASNMDPYEVASIILETFYE